MFKIVILQVVVAAAVAGPIYTGGMGYGGIGTSSVSVSRRTSVVSTPGMYGGMGGMGMGVGVYGPGMGLPLVEEKSAGIPEVVEGEVVEKEESETVVEKVETPVDAAVEVVRSMEGQAPLGRMTASVMGGMATPGIMGAGVAGSSRTDVMRAGMGGVEQTSVGESQVATPFGSRSSVSSVQERSGVML